MSLSKKYQQQKKGLVSVMQRSDNSDSTLTRNGHTVTLNLPEITTNTTTPPQTTLTTSPTTPQTLQSPQTSKQQPLPGPEIPAPAQHTGISGKRAGSTKKKNTPEPEPEPPVDPSVLSPTHEAKAQQLSGVYTQIGMLALGWNPSAGKILILTSQDRAREVLRVARHHKPLMKVVDQLIAGNDYIAFGMGHIGMLLSIFAVNGQLPNTPITAAYSMQGNMLLQQWEMMQTAMEQANGLQTNQHGPIPSGV